MASWNEEGYNGGGNLPGPSGSLAERKKQLLQWLAGRGATQAGFRGSAVGRQGGIGGRAPLPALNYNPFFSQIAGRQENFPFMPEGVSSAAANAVQQGAPGGGMGIIGPGGMNIGGGGPPAMGGGMPAPAAGVAQPQGGFAGHNLIGAGAPPVPIQSALGGQLQNATAPSLAPYDPFARNAALGSRGVFRM